VQNNTFNQSAVQNNTKDPTTRQETKQEKEQFYKTMTETVLYPLDFLCMRNDYRAVDALLSHSPNFALLSKYCYLVQCHAGITLKLLQYQASHNQSFRGITPLHISCRLGNLDVTAILLSLNAQTDLKDCNGCTPMDYAQKYKHSKIIDLLLIAEQTKGRTSGKHINYSIFDHHKYKDRLEFTRAHLTRAMERKNTNFFTKGLSNFFTLGDPVGATRNSVSRLNGRSSFYDSQLLYDSQCSYDNDCKKCKACDQSQNLKDFKGTLGSKDSKGALKSSDCKKSKESSKKSKDLEYETDVVDIESLTVCEAFDQFKEFFSKI
ncbi:ankyrin repeat-containing protein, partial [Pseudoloma neurophilia]